MGFEPNREFIAGARESLELQVRLIEESLTGSRFLVGKDLTIADSFLLPHLLFFGRTPEGREMLARAPAATAWLGRLCERESFAKSPMRTAYEAFAQLPGTKKAAWAA